MKATMKFLSTGIMALAITLASCTKDPIDGTAGPQGSQGEQGIQGPEGPQGQAGQDGEAQGVPGLAGADGKNGADGQNGEDGNANVRAFIYDYSEKEGGQFIQEIPEITADVIENDLILGYIRTNSRENSPIPTTRARIGERTKVDVAVNIGIGKYEFSFFKNGQSGFLIMPSGSLEELKIIIAKPSSISGKTDKESLRSELKSAGVDINDYYAVMNYFSS